MRMQKIKIKDINYEQKEYPVWLYESVERIGLSFPVKISMHDDGYQCVDGHKRLTILEKMGIEEVVVIVTNDGSTRTNDAWRSRNTH